MYQSFRPRGSRMGSAYNIGALQQSLKHFTENLHLITEENT
jgi:hypothetical protein